MNSLQLGTDKVLLTVFVTVLVGFLTAALSIVRLVNDKESKTTDYRQGWTDSLRTCFASLISSINLLAGRAISRMAMVDNMQKIQENKNNLGDEDAKRANEYSIKQLHDIDADIQKIRHIMHESYAKARLHFKPNDLSFARIEQKFDVISELFQKFDDLHGPEKKADRLVIREKIHAAAADLTAFSRDILKTEWEAVKRGEQAYQRTKFWAMVGGGVALAIILVFGIVTAWSFLRADDPTNRIITNSSRSNNYIKPDDPHSFSANNSTDKPSSQNQVVNLHIESAPCLGEKKVLNNTGRKSACKANDQISQ